MSEGRIPSAPPPTSFQHVPAQEASVLEGRLPLSSTGLAIVDLASPGHRQVSYCALERHTSLLAAAIDKTAHRQASVIALISPRCMEAVAGLLAIWRVRKVYCPLDHDAPQSRLALAIQEAQPAAILSTGNLSTLAGFAAEHRCPPLLSLESGRRLCDESSTFSSAGHPQKLPDDVAYLIHTSGTTGRPKLVMGTGTGLRARCGWGLATSAIERGEVCAARCAHSFVDALCEVLAPLQAGASLLLLPDASLREPHCLLHLLRAWRARRIVLVPHSLRALADACEDAAARRAASELSRPSSADPPPGGKTPGGKAPGGKAPGGKTWEPLPDMRLLSVSGDVLPMSLATQAAALVPAARVLNLYGCSEASADCTCYELAGRSGAGGAGNLSRSQLCPLGWPIAGAELRLMPVTGAGVDDAGDGRTLSGMAHAASLPSLAACDAGELIVGGPLVALGYLGQPDLTAKRFLEARLELDGELAKDTHTAQGGGASSAALTRWFRTGDWVRRAPEGSYHLLGRLDLQLQVRGTRVEASEVEAVYCAHDAVARAALVPLPPMPVDAGPMAASQDAAIGDHSRRDLNLGWEPRVCTTDQIVLCCQLRLDSGWLASVGADAAAIGMAEPVGRLHLLPELSVLCSSVFASWAHDTLPSAFRPTAFLVLRDWPVLRSGKTDRACLQQLAPAMLQAVAEARRQMRSLHGARPHPQQQQCPLSGGCTSSADGRHFAPSTPEESDALASLVSLLSELLGRPVWPDDAVADVGCTSVHAAQLAHALNRRHGWDLPMAAVLELGGDAAARASGGQATSKTLRALSFRMVRRRAQGDVEAAAEEQEAREAAYALTALDRRLWVQEADGPAGMHPRSLKRERDLDEKPDPEVTTGIRWTRGKAHGPSPSSTCTEVTPVSPPQGEQGNQRRERLHFDVSWRAELGKCVDASPLLVCLRHQPTERERRTDGRCQSASAVHMLARSYASRLTPAVLGGAHSSPTASKGRACALTLEEDATTPSVDSPGSHSSHPPVVLVGTYDDHLHALCLHDGVRLWSRRFHGSVRAAATALPSSMCPRSVCRRGGSGRVLWRPPGRRGRGDGARALADQPDRRPRLCNAARRDGAPLCG